MRSLVGLVGVAVIFLASLSALLGLFISVATYHIWTRIAVWPMNTDFYTTIRVIIYTSAALCKNLKLASAFDQREQEGQQRGQAQNAPYRMQSSPMPQQLFRQIQVICHCRIE